MKPFHFKKFTVNQSENVFRVGTDGVLLGVLSDVSGATKILEIGTGSGLISLMVAQRNPKAQILALDINEEAANLARENFKNSPFSDQLQAITEDFKNYELGAKFDHIISNPPYFLKNSSSKDILARQQSALNFEELISQSAKNLLPVGKLSVIIPYETTENFIRIASEQHLFLYRKVEICGIIDAKPTRSILEFGFDNLAIVEEKLTIEKAPRVYSDEYLELTKDFHQFKN